MSYFIHMLSLYAISLGGNLGSFYFQTLWIMLQWKLAYVFMWVYVLISHEYIFHRGITWSYGNSLYNFMRNCQTLFQNCCHILQSHVQFIKGFHFFHILANVCFCFFLLFFFYYNILVQCEKILLIWGTYYWQIMLLSIFMCLLAMYISTFFSFCYWVVRVFFFFYII